MRPNSGLKTFAVVAAILLLLSWLRLNPAAPPETISAGPAGEPGYTEEVLGDEQVDDVAVDDPAAAASAARGAATKGKRGPAGASGAAAAGPAGIECAPGKNGGATDTGVTASKIRLATTAVLDGPAKSLLEDSTTAMKAVVDKVNRAGGICGRLLDLKVVNDSFNASSGLQYIKNFIAEGYFALPVVPSAEGLGSAIESGEIAKAKIPVVGTDGMRKEQYGEAYVWPVAAATVTAMRVMAKYGYDNRNTRTFALVWDQKYKFGKEGREAFEAQVRAMSGADLVHTEALNPDDPSYAGQANTFNEKCGGGKCDMVALLLLPDTAKKWLQTRPAPARLYTSGAQTLFTDRFAQDCVLQLGSACEGFAVWTGYNPPIGPLASLPGVSAYVNDVRAVKSGIDITNQFVEGAYLGMTVFLEAVKRASPNLTREGLRAQMDALTFKSDLASELTWKPGQHAANVRAQSFSMATSQGAFRGWSKESDFLLDPAHGG